MLSRGLWRKRKKWKPEKKKKSKEIIKMVGAALNGINVDSDSNDDNDEKDVDIEGLLKAALKNMADKEARGAFLGGTNMEIDNEALKRRQIFSGLTFFLSYEIPLNG
jgi:hypothetical protein